MLVDVKGGWVAGLGAARRIPIDKWGMMIPVEKVGRDQAAYYVYCLCWPGDESYWVAPTGYTTTDVVESAPIRVNVTHPCHVVQIADLHPMAEFYRIVRNGLVMGAGNAECDLSGDTCNRKINGLQT